MISKIEFSVGISAFLRSLDAARRAPATKITYNEHFKSFTRWLTRRGHDLAIWPDELLIETYLAEEAERLKPTSHRNRFTALHALYEWAWRREYISPNPFNFMSAPRPDDHEQPAAEHDQYDQLMRSIPKSNWINQRDRLALACMYLSGVRIGGVLGLTVDDFLLERNELRVRKGKGGKTYYTILLPEVKVEFVDYMLMRPAVTGNELFFSADGGGAVRGVQFDANGHPLTITANGLRRIIKRRCEAAGLPSLRPHDFRRGLGNLLLSKGSDLRMVQQVLGHKDLSTTTRYAKHLPEAITLRIGEIMRR